MVSRKRLESRSPSCMSLRLRQDCPASHILCQLSQYHSSLLFSPPFSFSFFFNLIFYYLPTICSFKIWPLVRPATYVWSESIRILSCHPLVKCPFIYFHGPNFFFCSTFLSHLQKQFGVLQEFLGIPRTFFTPPPKKKKILSHGFFFPKHLGVKWSAAGILLTVFQIHAFNICNEILIVDCKGWIPYEDGFSL